MQQLLLLSVSTLQRAGTLQMVVVSMGTSRAHWLLASPPWGALLLVPARLQPLSSRSHKTLTPQTAANSNWHRSNKRWAQLVCL